MDCIFCQIARHESPKEFIYEDDDLMVFKDIHPQRKVHFLIVPKEHIKDFLGFSNNTIWVKMRVVLQQLIKENGLSDKGYQIKINGGGAQIIDHFHIHLIGPFPSFVL